MISSLLLRDQFLTETNLSHWMSKLSPSNPDITRFMNIKDLIDTCHNMFLKRNWFLCPMKHFKGNDWKHFVKNLFFFTSLRVSDKITMIKRIFYLLHFADISMETSRCCQDRHRIPRWWGKTGNRIIINFSKTERDFLNECLITWFKELR